MASQPGFALPDSQAAGPSCKPGTGAPKQVALGRPQVCRQGGPLNRATRESASQPQEPVVAPGPAQGSQLRRQATPGRQAPEKGGLRAGSAVPWTGAPAPTPTACPQPKACAQHGAGDTWELPQTHSQHGMPRDTHRVVRGAMGPS